MEDLLSFLSGKIKQKGMTVEEFCNQIGISRQKFYRFVKEPRRFTEQKVRSIVNVLSLNEIEIEQLEKFLYPDQPARSIPSYVSFDHQISEMLSRKLSDELSAENEGIEYTGSEGTVTLESVSSFAHLLTGSSGNTVRTPDPGSSHKYLFTIFNCVPQKVNISDGSFDDTLKDMSSIARVIKAIEDELCPLSPVSIRVRHYLSDSLQERLQQAEKGSKEALALNIQVFNAVLPLMSTAEDYYLEQTRNNRSFWISSGDYCLIQHTVLPVSGSGTAAGQAADPSCSKEQTEYYVLSFNHKGAFKACRLGSEEVSHIYRFMSSGSLPEDDLFTDNSRAIVPNQIYQQHDSQSSQLLIHPDLCFDDIPSELWMSFLNDAVKRPDFPYIEKMFRSLMDPYDQYSFLSFYDLATASISTLAQRIDSSNQNGKIVICHPDGLLNMIHTGLITDLISDAIDYTGRNLSEDYLRFPSSSIRHMLGLIKESIRKRQNTPYVPASELKGINYYILRPNFQYPEITITIYRESGIFPIYSKSRHKNSIINGYYSQAVSHYVYDYIVNDFIEKRGKTLDTAILSDEHSIILIDKLISILDRIDNDQGQGDNL